jgi:DNA-directed RNA polymerase II subunit RPB1
MAPKESTVIGVQFSLLSPTNIRNNSVAHVISKDMYTNNKPVIGGLFDPRMGVIESGMTCPTDGLDHIKCPGYFGHIELVRPVYYIQYLQTIVKVMRCVCVKCSRLLISKNQNKLLFNDLTGDARFHAVHDMCTKSAKGRKCGEGGEHGCGFRQPRKIRKEGLSSLSAEWDVGDSEKSGEDLIMPMSVEMVLKQLQHISDEDVIFMGFSAIFSRPDWMICQVMAIPPPSMRPSIKHDTQQRSEDDITHALVGIIKTNQSLKEKIESDAAAHIIEDTHTLLQYYVATQIDNKLPAASPLAQRSGRPLKSIKDRISGKTGRVRGNLMGKRVDFSARSVITPDPNISISDLGIPLKIAKNITKPVTVNEKNKAFLTRLVRNGPDVHPGAKIIEKKNGENISLRYVDRDSIELQIGDRVNRHMMDGDAILFNRQPTLHRMSMMCHITKILKRGDTFRMNVADTKPYNADFDGDEMNLHMPQDVESESELLNLAAVKHQIISPANNKPIVGVFQDSLLGIYRFTRANIQINKEYAMNMMMGCKNIDVAAMINNSQNMTNFEILSNILPPLSLKYKTNQFKDHDDPSTSNHVIEIVNGVILRGQFDKDVLGGSTKGILQRVCNDFGRDTAAVFIDEIQSIVTEYMKVSGYSVGISDLIADEKTNVMIRKSILDKIKEANDLIDETRLGVFKNPTGKSNKVEFETQINSILNDAAGKAGSLSRESLSPDNRFVIMVNAGSKGSDLNISQMTACLGQQNVDGKRIPYSYDARTLPHFTKYDDTPAARGFVKSNFIGGLSPTELYFHAMGGRVGLIDTAVKTSQTGYIQRRLIKSMEDIKICYDMTVRNEHNKIVQFSYGGDNFDTVCVENQPLDLMSMSIEDIYSYFYINPDIKLPENKNIFEVTTLRRMKKETNDIKRECKEITDSMLKYQHLIMHHVFKNQDDGHKIHIPVSFKNIIDNIQNQCKIQSNSMVDITPLEAFVMIQQTFDELNNVVYTKPNELFKVMYFFQLTPRNLLLVKRFNKTSLRLLLDNIVMHYKKALVAPGETVGMIAAQSIGEPTTQMTLNTFHFAGVASKSNVTRGVPRVEEILSLSSNPKNPSVTIRLYQNESNKRDKALSVKHMIEFTKLAHVVSDVSICFDPNDDSTLIDEDTQIAKQFKAFENKLNKDYMTMDIDNKLKSKWITRLTINPAILLEKNITMDDIHIALTKEHLNTISCLFSDYNSDKLIFRIRINKEGKRGTGENPLDQSDEIHYIRSFIDNLLENTPLRGIHGIQKALLRKDPSSMKYIDSKYTREDSWVLDTVGTNFREILALNYIDSNNTISNSITETYSILGIEAARQTIHNELYDVISHDGSYINDHHISMLCDRMTYSYKMISIFRHGINNDNIGPIAKASFEETPEMFLKAARHAELDSVNGVSSNIMLGQKGYFGTNMCQLYLDNDALKSIVPVPIAEPDEFTEILQDTDECSNISLSGQQNTAFIKKIELGSGDDFVVSL